MALLSGVFVVSALVTMLLVPLATRYALRRGLIDQPDARRSHRKPIPRGGGVAMLVVVVTCTALLTSFDWLAPAVGWSGAAGIAVVGIVGWWDDHRPLSPWTRLATHFSAALLVATSLPAFDFAGIPDWCWKALFVVSIVWITNLYNFMDGIDAMAAGEGLFWGLAASAFLVLDGGADGPGALALCIAGVSLGFLVYNRPPATVFMGDVGSGCLGFTIAWVILQAAVADPIVAMVLTCLLGAFLVDASATLMMRMWRRERWYNPHRSHAYQVLVRLGRSHAYVVVAFMLVNLVWVLPTAYWLNEAPATWRPAVAAVSFAALLLSWWRIQRRFSAGA